jgi:hypothetical protein
MMSALHDQLGLELEPKTRATEVLVVKMPPKNREFNSQNGADCGKVFHSRL